MISFNALMVVFINLAVLLNGAKGSGRFFEGWESGNILLKSGVLAAQ